MYKSAIPASGFDPSFSPAEDYDLFVRILEKHHLAILPKVLVDYRTHTNNLTATQSEKMKNAVVGIQKRQLENLKLDISEEVMKLHYDISFGGNVQVPEVEKWLIRIKKANEQHPLYDQKSLHFVLSHRWVKIFERNKESSSLLGCTSSELFKVNLHSLFILLKNVLVR
jgi:hypothetical protein